MSISHEVKIAGVIGDVHAEDELLSKAIRFLRDRRIQTILCVGDIADGRGRVDHCCTILVNEGITVVIGNHDQWLLKNSMRDLEYATQLDEISEESRLFLSSLPATYEFKTAGGLSLLCHGLGENDMARLTPDDYGYAIEANVDLQDLIKESKYRYVINGHTHLKMVRSFARLTVINAGTLKRDNGPGFLAIDFAQEIARFFRFNAKGTIEEAESVSLT